MRRSGQQSRIVMVFNFCQSTQKRSDPSFLGTNMRGSANFQACRPYKPLSKYLNNFRRGKLPYRGPFLARDGVDRSYPVVEDVTLLLDVFIRPGARPTCSQIQ